MSRQQPITNLLTQETFEYKRNQIIDTLSQIHQLCSSEHTLRDFTARYQTQVLNEISADNAMLTITIAEAVNATFALVKAPRSTVPAETLSQFVNKHAAVEQAKRNTLHTNIDSQLKWTLGVGVGSIIVALLFSGFLGFVGLAITGLMYLHAKFDSHKLTVATPLSPTVKVANEILESHGQSPIIGIPSQHNCSLFPSCKSQTHSGSYGPITHNTY